ncbi:hypothetical protein [Paenibacillus montanisoli]|uniref:Uncharacterized protein n=1 Tax=Paenibacillus montanisoli TaxID=2081970 RepID=A0A328UAU5_9BACL|nr:hypothetical protein [Paenibacillus montanisoli]RAP78045.1 hypothetical protein DL346_06255 [Paenibacillus montanisoli]
MMNAKKWTVSAITALVLVVNAGTLHAAKIGPSVNQQKQKYASLRAEAQDIHSNSEKLFNEYELLYKYKDAVPRMLSFLHSHIREVTSEHATAMVVMLESAVTRDRITMETKFSKPSIQLKLQKLYRPGDSMSALIDRTKDKDLKILLTATAIRGFKIETAEGYYFPVVNYKFFSHYNPFVTADMAAYVGLKTVETDSPAVKDGGLLISYSAMINRVLSFESFLKKYDGSSHTDEVKDMIRIYTQMTFYGVPNTPLFDPATKKLAPNAKKAFEAILQSGKASSSTYLAKLQKFMDVLKKNDYKRTNEVDKFLKDNIKNVLG